MRAFVIIAMFLSMAAIASSQARVKNPPTRQQVNDWLKSLNKNITDTARINILLRLADYNLYKQGYEKSDPDSAAAFIRSAKEINSRQITRELDGVVSFYESLLSIRIGNTDAGKELVTKAIKQLQGSPDKNHLVRAYLQLTHCYDSKVPEQAEKIKQIFNEVFQHVPKQIRQEQLDDCIIELFTFYNVEMRTYSFSAQLDFLDHLIQTFQIVNDKVNQFWARKEIADIHYNQGKLNMAIDELLEIAKEQKEGGYPHICFTYDLLAGLYYAGADYGKALYYSLETIKNVNTGTDSFYLSNFYLRVASLYSVTGSTAQAIEWNLKRLNYLIAIKQTDHIYTVILSITADLIRLGRSKEALNLVLDKTKRFPPDGNWEKRGMLLSLATCYAAVKDNAMAERYCEELIALNERRIKRKEVVGDRLADQFLASFYLSLGQYGKAEKYFKQFIDSGPTLQIGPGDSYTQHFLFKLDSAKGNYLSAIRHLQLYKMANDSIVTAAKSRQIEELKISYETEQKEQRIQLLTREDQIQKIKLQQGTLLRNISLGVAALLIIIVALLHNRYRLKQRTNQRLELQQREITKQNNSLHQLLNEKEWLLKEIHHRVKNNLQTVMSLLNSQSVYIDNEAALTAIHDSQHRVHAMSLIHQKLYNSENVSSIDMSFYIRELVSYLSDSFDTGQRIRFELNVEPLKMDVSQAVPLGLILNEAITNALKYAFPDGRKGIISISLVTTSPNHYLLTIADNGIGIHSHYSNQKQGSLGMSLMTGLSEDLDGKFSIENNNGTRINVSFIHETNFKRYNIVDTSVVSNN